MTNVVDRCGLPSQIGKYLRPFGSFACVTAMMAICVGCRAPGAARTEAADLLSPYDRTDNQRVALWAFADHSPRPRNGYERPQVIVDAFVGDPPSLYIWRYELTRDGWLSEECLMSKGRRGGGQKELVTSEKLAEFVGKMGQVPAAVRPKDFAHLCLVSYEDSRGDWVTCPFDRTNLPAAVREAFGVIGVRGFVYDSWSRP